MDLLHFGDNENWLCSMVGGQPNDIDFGFGEDIEGLDVGGTFGQKRIQCGFYQNDTEGYELDDFGQ